MTENYDTWIYFPLGDAALQLHTRNRLSVGKESHFPCLTAVVNGGSLQ